MKGIDYYSRLWYNTKELINGTNETDLERNDIYI